MAAGSVMNGGRSRVAFLFLGEMLLVPHLWPIVDALARMAPDLKIDVWVSTSAHEALIGGWLQPAHRNVRMRRAPGFAQVPDGEAGRNPPLPAKIPMLLRLAPHLARVSVVVCVEQTSLWLSRLAPWLSRFIFTAHGGGIPNYNTQGRLQSAYRLMFPTLRHLDEHVARGISADRVVETGYVKAGFRPSLRREAVFDSNKPILLFTPHWHKQRSSWWDWGREVVARLQDQDRFNVVIAPHQRLVEVDPKSEEYLSSVAEAGHIHVDTGSFAMVDGSYTAMADLYLGDSSSQILEFLMRPRPCVFLDSPSITWRSTEAAGHWKCGETITDPGALWDALCRAPEKHADYRAYQEDLVRDEFGDVTGNAPQRAAEIVLSALK